MKYSVHNMGWVDSKAFYTLNKALISGTGVGLVWIDAVIRNPFIDRAVAVEALVDMGATLGTVPRKIAEELQLPVIGRRRTATAKGVVELDECGILWSSWTGRHIHTYSYQTT